MTDIQINGSLSDEQAKIVEAGIRMHRQVASDLEAAQDEIAELRVRLAETEAALKAMREHNDFLEDKLNMAMVDRTRAIDERAEYAVKLDMLRKLLEPVQDNPA